MFVVFAVLAVLVVFAVLAVLAVLRCCDAYHILDWNLIIWTVTSILVYYVDLGITIDSKWKTKTPQDHEHRNTATSLTPQHHEHRNTATPHTPQHHKHRNTAVPRTPRISHKCQTWNLNSNSNSNEYHLFWSFQVSNSSSDYDLGWGRLFVNGGRSAWVRVRASLCERRA